MAAKIIHTMDTETDPFEFGEVPEPFTVGHYTGTAYYEFFGDDCLQQYIQFLKEIEEEDKKDLIVYVHNGGRFDFHFFLEFCGSELIIINGSIAEFSIEGVKFRDSIFILPRALSSYKKDEIDYNIFKKENRYRDGNIFKILEYQKKDCIYLHEWVSSFIESYGIHLTLAGAAFKQLKLTDYKVTNSSELYDTKYRDFYYGGRTEVFKSGSHYGDVEYYDINSAYSFAMLDEHPHGTEVIELPYIPSTGVYFAKIKAISSGALPFRDPDTYALTFPNDAIERIYNVTSWEIRAGLDTNTLRITEVIRVYKHTRTANFKTFVNKFFKLKKQHEDAGDMTARGFVKLILNSVYGKFAVNCRNYKKYEITKLGDLPDELYTLYIKYNITSINKLASALNNDKDLSDSKREKLMKSVTWKISQDMTTVTIWERDDPGKIYYNVATAASITGYVRALMWRSICLSDSPIYCDTDSIMCKRFNGDKSDKIGGWSKECLFSELHIGGKKLYAGLTCEDSDGNNIEGLDIWKTASKGARLEPLDIKKIVAENSVIVWQKAAPSFSLKYGARFIERKIKKTV